MSDKRNSYRVPKMETTKERYREVYYTYLDVKRKMAELSMPSGAKVLTMVSVKSITSDVESALNFKYDRKTIDNIVRTVENNKREFRIA